MYHAEAQLHLDPKILVLRILSMLPLPVPPLNQPVGDWNQYQRPRCESGLNCKLQKSPARRPTNTVKTNINGMSSFSSLPYARNIDNTHMKNISSTGYIKKSIYMVYHPSHPSCIYEISAITIRKALRAWDIL